MDIDYELTLKTALKNMRQVDSRFLDYKYIAFNKNFIVRNMVTKKQFLQFAKYLRSQGFSYEGKYGSWNTVILKVYPTGKKTYSYACRYIKTDQAFLIPRS